MEYGINSKQNCSLPHYTCILKTKQKRYKNKNFSHLITLLHLSGLQRLKLDFDFIFVSETTNHKLFKGNDLSYCICL